VLQELYQVLERFSCAWQLRVAVVGSSGSSRPATAPVEAVACDGRVTISISSPSPIFVSGKVTCDTTRSSRSAWRCADSADLTPATDLGRVSLCSRFR
jgi:hypothetical protein